MVNTIDPEYLVVEDGSGYTNSNAYWDVASVKSYLLNKGILDVQNYTNDQIARAIISATMYIEKRFKRRFRGLRQQVEQQLGWPRIGAFDDDNFTIFGVPYQIQFACAEYTIRALRLGVLAPDPLRTVPDEDLSQPRPGVTYATQTFTGTSPSTNFMNNDTITIGNRVYTFVNTTPLEDGQVALGSSLVYSLINLGAAINNSNNLATGVFTATQNFLDGDSVTIGDRSYVFHTVLQEFDGCVLIGASTAASLLNLEEAINNTGDVGNNVYVTQDDPNVTAVSTSSTLTVTARVQFTAAGFVEFQQSPISVTLTASTGAGSWGSPTLIQEPNTNFYVLNADPNVTAQVTPTTLVVTATNVQGNSVTVSTTSAAGAWGAGTLAGGSYTPSPPSLILGPIRTRTQRIGPLEESESFDGLAALAIRDERTTRSAQSGIVNDYNLPEYPEADLWLEQIIRNPSSGTRLVRGS